MQLHALLSKVAGVSRNIFVPEKHSFSEHHPVLSAPKGKNVHTSIKCECTKVFVDTYCCIRNSGAVHMKKHIMPVCKVCHFLDFFYGVNRAVLRRLGNGNNFRLGVMLISKANQLFFDVCRLDLPMILWHRYYFAAGESLRGSRFINIDVGQLRTYY